MDYYEVTTGPNYNSSTGWASELNQIHVPHATRGIQGPITIRHNRSVSGVRMLSI